MSRFGAILAVVTFVAFMLVLTLNNYLQQIGRCSP